MHFRRKVSPANKNLLIISFILYNCNQNKRSLNIGILLKSVLIPRLLNNSFASCFLINLALLVLHTAHFDNIIVPSFIAFETNGLMLFVLSPHFRQQDNINFIHRFFIVFQWNCIQRSCTQNKRSPNNGILFKCFLRP